MDRAVETLLGTSGRLSELHQLGFFFLCRSKETIIKKGRIKNATKSKKKADRFEGFVVSGNVELIVRRKCRPDREVITGREKRKYTKNSYKNKKE